MTTQGQAAAPAYLVYSSGVSQDDAYSMYLDLVVKPAVHIGGGLADFLYGNGGQGEMQFNTLYQDPDGAYTHVELRSSPKPDRLTFEMWIMLDRLQEYLNEVDKSNPNEVQRMRLLASVNVAAACRYEQSR